MTKKETVKKTDIMTVYRMTGICSVIWCLALLSKLYIPWIYETVSGYGFLSWIGWNIGVPFFLYYILKKLVRPSKGLLVAFCTLTGCCITVTGLHILSEYFFIQNFIRSAFILIMSAVGYIAGYRFYIRDRFHDLYSDGIFGRILKNLIYGFVAGWILSSLFSNLFVSETVFIISMLHISMAHMILTDQVKKLKDCAFGELEKERIKKMASLDEYDEKIRKFDEEKVARERAEKARREREREEQERRSRYSDNRQHQRQSQSGSRSFTRYYFSGCNNKAELKRRYRQLCKKLHPDCPGGSAESFRRMQAEYEHLLKFAAV